MEHIRRFERAQHCRRVLAWRVLLLVQSKHLHVRASAHNSDQRRYNRPFRNTLFCLTLLSAVLMLLIPVWTCAICVLLGREEKSWTKFAGIFITIGGIAHSSKLWRATYINEYISGAITLLEIESLEVSGDTMTGNLLVILTTVRDRVHSVNSVINTDMMIRSYTQPTS